MLKLVKEITAILLGIVIMIGFLLGIYGGMADTSVNEQRMCMIQGFSIVLSAILAIGGMVSDTMKFRLKTKTEIVFYLSLVVLSIFVLYQA